MNIQAYRQELVRKLAAVDAIIAEMGGGTKQVGRPKGSTARRGKRRGMSAAGRARIAAAARARWAKAKKAGKNSL